MAKGQRASTVKRNNSALRAKFAPIYDARTARLSAKLQEIVSQPKPAREEVMEVDDDESKEDGDVDMNGSTKAKMKDKYTTKKRGPTRVMKKIANRKAKKSVVFERNSNKKKRLASDMAKKKS